MTLCVRINSALNLAHTSPENIRRIPVLLIACNHAALASDALRHIEVKPVLLTRTRTPQRSAACAGSAEGDRLANGCTRRCNRNEAFGLFSSIQKGKFHAAPERRRSAAVKEDTTEVAGGLLTIQHFQDEFALCSSRSLGEVPVPQVPACGAGREAAAQVRFCAAILPDASQHIVKPVYMQVGFAQRSRTV